MCPCDWSSDVCSSDLLGVTSPAHKLTQQNEAGQFSFGAQAAQPAVGGFNFANQAGPNDSMDM